MATQRQGLAGVTPSDDATASAPAVVWLVDLPIETQRLTLRVHRSTDVDDLLVFHSDPEVVRYLPWPVRDRAQVEEVLARKLSQDRAEHDGDWIVLAVEERRTSRVVGEILVKRQDAVAGVAELGFALAREAQGRGLGTEAAQAMLGVAAGLGAREVHAVADSRNVASAALLAKLGFHPVPSTTPDTVRFTLSLTPRSNDADR